MAHAVVGQMAQTAGVLGSDILTGVCRRTTVAP